MKSKSEKLVHAVTTFLEEVQYFDAVKDKECVTDAVLN